MSYTLYIYIGHHESLGSGFFVYQRALLQGLSLLISDLVVRETGRPDGAGGLVAPRRVVCIGSRSGPLEDLVRECSDRSGVQFSVGNSAVSEFIAKRFRRFATFFDLFFSSFCCLKGVLTDKSVRIYHASTNTVPFFLSAPVVLTLHDLIQAGLEELPNHGEHSEPFPRRLYRTFKTTYYRYLIRSSILRSTLVLTGHEKSVPLIKQLVGETHFQPEKVKVLYPAFELEHLERIPSKAEMEAVPQRGGALKLLALASRDQRKNIDVALKALSELLNRKSSDTTPPSANLTIVCSTPTVASEMRAIASQLIGLENIDLQINISREDLAELYKSTDLLIFPSLAEGFGYPIYEAISLGVKVVADETLLVEGFPAEARSLFFHASRGRGAEAVSELATAINRALSTPIDSTTRQKAAVSIQELLHPKRQAENYLKAISTILRK